MKLKYRIRAVIYKWRNERKIKRMYMREKRLMYMSYRDRLIADYAYGKKELKWYIEPLIASDIKEILEEMGVQYACKAEGEKTVFNIYLR